MSWHYLQAGEVASWEGTCLDGAPSALLSLLPTSEKSCLPVSGTSSYQSSPFGTMCEPLTESHGVDKLTLSAGDSPAKISVQRGGVLEYQANEADFGKKWRASFAKYNHDLSLWKTAQCSLVEDLESFSGTWPRWGLMRGGECWELMTLEPTMPEIGYGLWPTPVKSDALVPFGHKTMEKKEKKERRKSGAHIGSQLTWFRGALPYVVDGRINPILPEWLMGWPPGWTDLQPLAMDKFQQWQRQHGESWEALNA